MNQGQEKFMGFILERVKDGDVEEAKTLLSDNFKKQSEGNFTQADIAEFIPKIISLLKPDKIEEVKAVMKQFAGSFGK
jgi:hypothetical protein